MNSPREELSPERLVEVAIVLMRVCSDMQDRLGSCPYPLDLLGSPQQPRELCEFTRFEVEEASAFLARLGFIERRRASKSK